MKHTATMEDTRCSFDEMTLSLRDHFNKINPENSESIKLSNEYYKWISLKTSLVLNEKTSGYLSLPCQIPLSHLHSTGSILKNLKDSLVVIPLSSQMPKTMDYNVKIDKVYGFPEMPRWANVTRIAQVSLSRIHFEKFGDVKPAVLKDISEKLTACGII